MALNPAPSQFVQGSLLGQQTSKRRRMLFPELQKSESALNGFANLPAPPAYSPNAGLGEFANCKGGRTYMTTSSAATGKGVVGALPGASFPLQKNVSSWPPQAQDGMLARSCAGVSTSLPQPSPSAVSPSFMPWPAQTWNDGIFNLSIHIPTDLPRLSNSSDLSPANPAEMLFQALPLFPEISPSTPPTNEELARALGFVELPLTDPGYAWPPIEQEFLEEPSQELRHEASAITSLETISKLDAVASRWEAEVQKREELRILCDWSFERSLPKPCQAIIEALSATKRSD